MSMISFSLVKIGEDDKSVLLSSAASTKGDNLGIDSLLEEDHAEKLKRSVAGSQERILSLISVFEIIYLSIYGGS